MTTKHRPRKHRYVDPRATFKAIARRQTFSAKEQQRLSIMARLTLRELTHGNGNINALNEIAILVNVTTVLGEQVGQECVDVCLPAVQHVKDAGERLKKHGYARLDGQGVQSLNAVLDLYEQFLEHITPAQHEAAWAEMFRRLDARNIA